MTNMAQSVKLLFSVAMDKWR